ncbi:MAG TPA: hypothetical protein VIL55_02405 [Naasia sp.]
MFAVEKINYCAGSSFVTGDAIAGALIEYARWVTALQETARVWVPLRRPDGSVGRIRILLSRVTQLSSEVLPESSGDLHDDDFLDEMRRRTRLLASPPTPQPESPESPEEILLSLDY